MNSFCSNDIESNDSINKCVICLDTVSYQLLECGHYFHRTCILEYYKINTKEKCCVCSKSYTTNDMNNINNNIFIKLKQFFNLLPKIENNYIRYIQGRDTGCIVSWETQDRIEKIASICFGVIGIVGLLIVVIIYIHTMINLKN